MSQLQSVVLLSAIGVFGLLVAVDGWIQPAPTLRQALARLDRAEAGDRSARSRFRMQVAVRISGVPRLMPNATELQLVQRSAEEHGTRLIVAAAAGAAAPAGALAVLQFAGVTGPGGLLTSAIALAGAVLGPLWVHASTVERAAERRTDLRYQVSAYLDVITMLLAANTGYEGALEQAAHAGDGRLFGELRRQMRQSAARGLSMTDALQRTGAELGLDELEQVAATAALSAAEGAPVARTLAAKCATMRSALATEAESEARLRTSRLTTPIVGMALIFMALVIYPALSFS
ncbi:MAG TPA: type II secretion system F family protein [Ilumatobacter sp.]